MRYVQRYCTAGQTTDDNTAPAPLACWVPKDTNTYSEYAIFIAFKGQQWLHESASLLRNKCITCHV